MTTAADLLDGMRRARDAVRAARSRQGELKALLRDAKKAVAAAQKRYELATEEAFAERRQPSLFDAADAAPAVDPVTLDLAGQFVRATEPVAIPTAPATEMAPVGDASEWGDLAPTWRATALDATGWDEELGTFTFAALFAKVRTVGDLADALQKGDSFGLDPHELNNVYALVEMISSDDEQPISFDAFTGNFEPPAAPDAKPTPVGLGLIVGFPSAALKKLVKAGIRTLGELRDKADALPSTVDFDVRMYAVIRGAGVASATAREAANKVLYRPTTATALDLERASQKLKSDPAPYGWDITYVTNRFETLTCHYVGTEKVARKKAMMRPGAKQITECRGMSERDYVRAFGRGKS